MRLSMGYMSREQELDVIARPSSQVLVEELEQAVTNQETAALMAQIPHISVSDDVAGYILDIVTRTRRDSVLVSGVSTRGAIALYKASQVTAALAGRDYVIPEDVKKEAIPVLAHRLSGGSSSRTAAEEYLTRLLGELTTPVEAL